MDVLLDRERLKVLRELALIDGDAETVYDRMTQLASRAIDTPVSLVSMVAADYQFFKSYVGLPEPWASDRRTPLSHSFCQHVVASNEPLIVTDARQHPLVKDNLAIPDLNVIGYLGVPLTLSDGRRLGSFCVIDGEPREWTRVEIDIVTELADIVINEIDLRARVNINELEQDRLDDLHDTIDNFIDSLDTNTSKEDFLQQVREAKNRYTL